MNRRKFVTAAAKTVSVAACSPLFSMLSAPNLSAHSQSSATNNKSAKPQLALTLDDPRTNLENLMPWQEANSRLLKSIDAHNVRAALFVTGVRVDDPEGAKLLTA